MGNVAKREENEIWRCVATFECINRLRGTCCVYFLLKRDAAFISSCRKGKDAAFISSCRGEKMLRLFRLVMEKISAFYMMYSILGAYDVTGSSFSSSVRLKVLICAILVSLMAITLLDLLHHISLKVNSFQQQRNSHSESRGPFHLTKAPSSPIVTRPPPPRRLREATPVIAPWCA